MGTTYSLPEEVLTTKVAKYSFENRKDFLALRATSKSGLALAQRGLSSCSSSCSCRYVHFRGEADPRHDEAMGRVFGAGCTFLSAVFFSPGKDRGTRPVRPENEWRLADAQFILHLRYGRDITEDVSGIAKINHTTRSIECCYP